MKNKNGSEFEQCSVMTFDRLGRMRRIDGYMEKVWADGVCVNAVFYTCDEYSELRVQVSL